jgi:hypothetical protein
MSVEADGARWQREMEQEVEAEGREWMRRRLEETATAEFSPEAEARRIIGGSNRCGCAPPSDQ